MLIKPTHFKELRHLFDIYSNICISSDNVFTPLFKFMRETNNYFFNSLFFILSGIKDNRFWEVFFHPLSGRELRKIRKETYCNPAQIKDAILLRTLIIKKWEWTNTEALRFFSHKDYEIRLLDNYRELERIANILRVCSAGREDLVRMFRETTMLRFGIYQGDEVVGTIAIYPNFFKSKVAFYGLAQKHVSISEQSLAYKEINPTLLEAYQAFYRHALRTKPLFRGAVLRRKDCFDPYEM